MEDSSANIASVLVRSAEAAPQRLALIQEDESISYSGLLVAVQRAAGGLAAMGVCRGDAVLVAVPMSIELYITTLALLYAGAVPVFMDAWVGRRRMAQCMETLPCKAIIAPRRLLWLSLLFDSLRRIPIRSTPGALLRGEALSAPRSVAGHDTALVTFTTGSTGAPKAARRTHRLLYAQLDALRPILPQGPEPALTNLPIVVLLHLAMGKANVLPPRGFRMTKPAGIAQLEETIHRHLVQSLVVSPSLIGLLADRGSMPGLQHIVTGGGPVFPALARRILKSFPGTRSLVVYGSTEAEPISHIEARALAGTSDEQLKECGLPVGLPHPHASVRIIAWNDAPLEDLGEEPWSTAILPAGEAGEIVVAGPHVLEHYINNPEAESRFKIRAEGRIWHRTGDAGRLDKEGQLYLLGRCTEIIRWQGQVIYPSITGYELSQLPGVRDAALLLVGTRLLVVVEAEGDIPLEAVSLLLQHHRIDDAKIIRLKALPRDPRHHTKLDYEALRKLLARKGL